MLDGDGTVRCPGVDVRGTDPDQELGCADRPDDRLVDFDV
jgi:hypothetical protein